MDLGETRSVNTGALSKETGGIALAGRETTIVEAVEDERAGTGAMRLVQPGKRCAQY